MEKINGIVIDGCFYEAVEGISACNGCQFNTSKPDYGRGICSFEAMPCWVFPGFDTIFRYSPSLTERLKGKEDVQKKARELYRAFLEEYQKETPGSENKISLGARIAMLQELFGENYLSDNPDLLNGK